MGLQDKKKKKLISDTTDQLQEFIDLAKTNVITLGESIDNVTAGVNDAIRDNSHITSVVNDVSRSTNDQLRLVQNTTTKVNQLNSTVETITESIGNMQELAIGSNEAVANGRDNLDTYKSHIVEVTESMQNTANFIGILRENIAEIAETIKLIVRISDQLCRTCYYSCFLINITSGIMVGVKDTIHALIYNIIHHLMYSFHPRRINISLSISM